MSSSPFGGSDFMFTLIPAFVVLIFIAVFGIIIYSVIQGAIQWNRNNNSPVLTVYARIVAKRMAVSQHMHHNHDNMAMSHCSTSTTYYATFEVESGDRMELKVPSREYGMLVEGDAGQLTFQGTRYKGFERNRN